MLPHSHWQQKCQHTTRASAGWQKKNARKKFGMIFHFAFFFLHQLLLFFFIKFMRNKRRKFLSLCGLLLGRIFFLCSFSVVCAVFWGLREKGSNDEIFCDICDEKKARRERWSGRRGWRVEESLGVALWKNKYFILFSAPLFLPSYERSESTASEAAVNEQVSRVVGDDTAEDKPFVRNTR